MKEYWINVYDHNHDFWLFWHLTRWSAENRTKLDCKPIYRIHVRLK